MSNKHHEKVEFEFIAKRTNDFLKNEFKNENLGFMSFVFSMGQGGYLGYLSSSRRIDALAMILEWLAKVVPELTTEQTIELINKIRAESEHAGN